MGNHQRDKFERCQVHSSTSPAPVDLETVNETEPLASSKSWTKLISTVTRGFVSTPSPVDLETVNENWATTVFDIVNETYSKGDAWIRMWSQPLLTQKNSTKTESVATGKSLSTQVPKVTSGFLSAPSAVDLETINENWATSVFNIVNETDSKGDACIQKCSQPMLTQKKSTKTESVANGKSSMKQVLKVTSGFLSAPSPYWLRNC